MAREQAQNVEAALLDHTIDTIPAVKLRQLFKTICKISPEARKQAEKLLLASQNKQDAKLAPHDNENGQSEGAKQPVPRFTLCENREKEYDVTTNSSTSC